jgi:AraC-like DNA-binding protein/ligand-binding sensor protein
LKENNFSQDATFYRGRNDRSWSGDQKIVSVYMRATGTDVQVFDSNFRFLAVNGDVSIEQKICRYCSNSANCTEMHRNAIRESTQHGRPHIYQCELGFIFWVSSMYSDGKFSGALRGSGYLSDKTDKSVVAEKCNGTIPPAEFSRYVSAFPLGDMEKIQSLAEMLLLCAEFLSNGDENHHEKLRLRSEQQASLSVLINELKIQFPDGSTLPGYPLDKERELITSLHRGDKEETEKLLNEVLAVLIFSNPEQFQYIQLQVLELAVMLVRAGGNPTNSTSAEINVHYFKQIQEAKTVEELTGTLHSIVDSIIEQIISFQGIPHALALRKAELFIRENLTRKINLREIAKVAGLSAPYFSTVFKEEMGENLSRYINRLRVEKSIRMLLETNSTLSEISSACCFQDQSWFSKIFKSFTGISPGKYRSQGGPLFAQRSGVDE